MAFAGRRIAKSTGFFLWLVPEQRSQFLHQLGCIGVAVRRYRVGRSRLQMCVWYDVDNDIGDGCRAAHPLALTPMRG
jgi:hypothetical protein